MPTVKFEFPTARYYVSVQASDLCPHYNDVMYHTLLGSLAAGGPSIVDDVIAAKLHITGTTALSSERL